MRKNKVTVCSQNDGNDYRNYEKSCQKIISDEMVFDQIMTSMGE